MKYIQTQIKTEVSQLISHAEPLIYFISLDCGTFEPPYTYHTLIRDIQARSITEEAHEICSKPREKCWLVNGEWTLKEQNRPESKRTKTYLSYRYGIYMQRK